MYLGNATEGIGILNVLLGGVETGAVRQGAPNALRDKCLPSLLAQHLKSLIEGLRSCIERIDGYASDQVCPIGDAVRTEKGQRTDGRHKLCSVEQRQAFLGAQAKVLVFLCRPPVGCIHCAFVLRPKLALTDQRKNQMSQRREIAGRPERTKFIDHRCRPRIEKVQ